MFLFGDFNIHHKDWLTYSGGTDRTCELCYDFSISNDCRCLTFLLESSTVNFAVLLFQICLFLVTVVFFSAVAFPPSGNSDDVAVSVSIDFSSNTKWDALFHCIAYDYYFADWDGLCDHLRDVPLEDIFKRNASAAASEFCDWIQVGIVVYIPHYKCQVKLHSSP